MFLRLLRNTHILFGLILIAIGVSTIFFPTVMEYYGIAIDRPESRIAIRAIIGGGELGLGLALVLGKYIGMEQRTLNGVSAFVFLSVGLVRLGAIYPERFHLSNWQPWREGLLEVFFGALAIAAFLLSSLRAR